MWRTAPNSGARRVEEGGRLRLVVPKDEGVFNPAQIVNGLPLASDVQIYLDLVNAGLRGDEAANELRRWPDFSGLGMTQKTDTFSGYPARSLEVAQCALITAWESLEIIGTISSWFGALPCITPSARRSFEQQICPVRNSRRGFRHFAGSVAGMYGTILSDLSGLGFKQEK